MSDIEKIKEEKLKELQKKQSQDQRKAMKKAAMNNILDEGARERLNNIKLTQPELVDQIESYLIQVNKTGQLQVPVTEDQMIEILKMLNQGKDWNIKRK